jgi:hypothetical protein
MSIKSTRELGRESCIKCILYELEKKKDRIVGKTKNLSTVLLKIGIEKSKDNCLFKEWLTEEEYTDLVNSLESLSNTQLEDLLEIVNDSIFENFLIVVE